MPDVVEGRNAILETLRAGGTIRELMIARGLKPNSGIDEIRRRAVEASIPVREVDRRELDALSARGAHQGVIGTVESFGYAELEEVLRRIGDRERSLLVVLDHVTDPGNLGAVIRSAEALGADGVVIPKARAASVGPVVVKSSAGATAHIPVVRVSNIVRTIETLKERSYWVTGASERGDQSSWDARLDGRLVLALGAEGLGVDDSRIGEKATTTEGLGPMGRKEGVAAHVVVLLERDIT